MVGWYILGESVMLEWEAYMAEGKGQAAREGGDCDGGGVERAGGGEREGDGHSIRQGGGEGAAGGQRGCPGAGDSWR